MAYHFFYWASNLQNIPPFEQVSNKIKTKTLQVCLSQFYQGLWFSSECKFEPLQGERHFSSNHQRCSKNLSSKSLKETCEGVDFTRNLQFYKKWVIHRCFLRVLYQYQKITVYPSTPIHPGTAGHCGFSIYYWSLCLQ